METIEIRKGETYRDNLLWLTENDVFATATAATMAAPPQITAANHGLVSNQPIKLECVKPSGHPLNNWEGVVTVIDPSTFELPDVNAHCYPPVEGSFVVRSGDRKDLTGYTGRMQIRSKEGAVLLELTTANGGITIDPVSFQIVVLISATQTAAFPGNRGRFELEMESPAGEVTKIFTGIVVAFEEVTT